MSKKASGNAVVKAEVATETAPAAPVPRVQLMIGFAYRRVPALGRAKVLICKGLIGAIRHVRVALVNDWLTDESVSTAGWLGKEAAGSGALSEIACHAIDLIQHLTGQFVTEATGLLRTSVMHDGTMWATLGLCMAFSAKATLRDALSGRGRSPISVADPDLAILSRLRASHPGVWRSD
ncbi:Gfo/Idh/MocA family protein [Paenarthrobacter aromaticivorans]|uniref:GFO/IDH/MocA-like oxidoreductase domain-containing protein n=1 Tax=Paenarthrobacter aromaticivorans TaxID=2849150 RepID=A0ABS6I7Q0_9MICC|nr:Gfo/Idh/MocA family oxidoreductase [Paenarthrobacter sp. MMS21-TAE1-1]MBU8867731.1 hypothetical protein [Paenarthrobacter sp. MMS21-TAE1-1]